MAMGGRRVRRGRLCWDACNQWARVARWSITQVLRQAYRVGEWPEILDTVDRSVLVRIVRRHHLGCSTICRVRRREGAGLMLQLPRC